MKKVWLGKFYKNLLQTFDGVIIKYKTCKSENDILKCKLTFLLFAQYLKIEDLFVVSMVPQSYYFKPNIQVGNLTEALKYIGKW